MFASSNSATGGAVSSQAEHSHQKQHQQPELTVLEQEVIDEYQQLRDNLDKLSSIIATLTANPTSQILDSLRQLERKTGVVYTLLKASVYSIVLQQEMHDADVGGAAMGVDIDEMLSDDG